MICIIMGYDNHFLVDENTLRFILKITQSVKFNFSKYVSDNIYEQLVYF
jgi:hypothetical protein